MLLVDETAELLVDETAEGAKCENLEKIVVDDDSENFFRLELSYILRKRKS